MPRPRDIPGRKRHRVLPSQKPKGRNCRPMFLSLTEGARQRTVHDPLAVKATVSDLAPQLLAFAGPSAVVLQLREHVAHRLNDGESVTAGQARCIARRSIARGLLIGRMTASVAGRVRRIQRAFRVRPAFGSISFRANLGGAAGGPRTAAPTRSYAAARSLPRPLMIQHLALNAHQRLSGSILGHS
jgi:hypothetical protein